MAEIFLHLKMAAQKLLSLRQVTNLTFIMTRVIRFVGSPALANVIKMPIGLTCDEDCSLCVICAVCNEANEE
jgi:hypothetical protein